MASASKAKLPESIDSKAFNNTKRILWCPMTAKREITEYGSMSGGTFQAWAFRHQGRMAMPQDVHVSYGINFWLSLPPRDWYLYERYSPYCWSSCDVKGANNIPVKSDSCLPWISMRFYFDPPECDAIPDAKSTRYSLPGCINRHDGGINMLFMDWSVRKVGLKELWTLKWNRKFDTSNRWTKAGGAQPEDWPQWMRSFKDY